jgi:hypothetical protein
VNDEEQLNMSVGYSRRAALKRGAVVGGAVVWAVPAVQAISMISASAENPSAPQPPANPPTPGTPTTGQTPPVVQSTPAVSAPVAGTNTAPAASVATATTTAQGGKLAYTGVDALPMATVGVGLVAAGAALTAVARRRDDSASPEQGLGPQHA